MSQGPWSHHSRSSGVADDIDFEVKGQELQFVEIELDPAARENFDVSVDAVKELLEACKQIDESLAEEAVA